MNKLEIRQELEKLAKKLAATDMGSPVGEGAQLQALWILHQLCDEPVDQDSDRGNFGEIFNGIQEAHAESIEIIRELRQQLLDKDEMIYSMARRLTGSVLEILNQPSSISKMTPILLEQVVEYGDEKSWPIENIAWGGVHACAFRAPKSIHIESKRLSTIDVGKSYREWIRIDADGQISLSGKEGIAGLEFVDEKVAAVYRFDDSQTNHANLVWERRFVYTAQMTREQQTELEKKEK